MMSTITKRASSTVFTVVANQCNLDAGIMPYMRQQYDKMMTSDNTIVALLLRGDDNRQRVGFGQLRPKRDNFRLKANT